MKDDVIAKCFREIYQNILRNFFPSPTRLQGMLNIWYWVEVAPLILGWQENNELQILLTLRKLVQFLSITAEQFDELYAERNSM